MEPIKSQAHKNWAKVRQIFLNKHKPKTNKQKRNYNLIPYEECRQQLPGYGCALKRIYDFGDAKIIHFTPIIETKELIQQMNQNEDIDTTGNWIWEAEEVATYFILKMWANLFEERISLGLQQQNIRVLELGAGTSGLAAIAITSLGVFKQNTINKQVNIVITDGRKENIQCLGTNIKWNGLMQFVEARHLVWGDQTVLNNRNKSETERQIFDVIIVSDCLFFEEYHQSLITTLDSFMDQKSIALFVNPKRGESMSIFLSMLKPQGFIYQFLEFQDETYLKQAVQLRQSSTYDKQRDEIYFIKVLKLPSLLTK